MQKEYSTIEKEVLRDYMQQQGIKLTYAKDEDNPKGGATIAWKYAGDFPGARVLEVAVEYCHPNDSFNKEIGRYNVLTNFENGETIRIPIGKNPHSVPYILQNMFWWNQELVLS